MRLADAMKTNRIRQIDIIKAMNKRYGGIAMQPSRLSMVVNGVTAPTDEQRKRMRVVLQSDLGIPADLVDSIN